MGYDDDDFAFFHDNRGLESFHLIGGDIVPSVDDVKVISLTITKQFYVLKINRNAVEIFTILIIQKFYNFFTGKSPKR